MTWQETHIVLAHVAPCWHCGQSTRFVQPDFQTFLHPGQCTEAKWTEYDEANARVAARTATVITNDTRGFWRVRTETAVYELDLDGRTLVRLPGGEAPIDFSVAFLRRDGDVIPLLEVLNQVVVGEDMYLLIQVREDGTSTVRRTTPVVDMERLR